MAYIGNSPENIQRGRRAIYEFTSTAGQTVYTGLDDNNQTLDLLEANEQSVFLNGIRLVPTDDYTVSGDTLTLTSAASLNDHMIIETQTEVGNAVTYTRAESDARYINYDGDIVAGDLQISGEVDAGSLIVDTDVLVVDATNNRVGIGTTDPKSTLDTGYTRIYNSGAASSPSAGKGLEVHYVTSGRTQGEGAYLISYDRDNSAYKQLVVDANNIELSTGGNNRLTILSGGNVGIGTTNPSQILEAQTSSTTYVTATTTGTGTSAGHRSTAGTNDWVWFATQGQPNYRLYDYASSAVRLTVTNSGNVGIGTTSPDALLHVQHTSAVAPFIVANRYNDTSVSPEFRPIFAVAEADPHSTGTTATIIGNHNRHIHIGSYFNATGSTAAVGALTILSSGNVGIGTDNPGKLLTLSRATEAQNEQLEFRNVGGISNGNFDGIRWSQGSTGGTTLAEQRINYYDTGVVDMSFNLRNEDSVLYLKAGGNVGVGNANPQRQVHIGAADNSNHDAVIVLNNGGATGNRAGIEWRYEGITAPRARLSINASTLELEADINGTKVAAFDGDGLKMTAGKGIKFSAYGSGNILDDYEEGDFQPYFSTTGNSGSISYSSQQGTYTKIGRRVFFWFDFTVSSWSGASGLPLISLPFASSGTSEMGAFTPWDIHNNYTGSRTPTQWISQNSSWMRMYTWAGDTATGHNPWSVNQTGRVSGSISYTSS